MNDITTNQAAQEIPYGYCHCGCGQKTNPSPRTNRSNGYFKGQPYRFVHGHHYRMRQPKSIIARFWEKVLVGSPNTCWEWKAGKNGSGYGVLKVGNQSVHAHRVSYELHHGSIPDGMFVCHTCDNRKCVNPAHLFLGTNADNMADMVRKGRSPRAQGEKHYKRKLTESDVLIIRERYAAGARIFNLAAEYGVSHGALSHIVRRRSWKHI